MEHLYNLIPSELTLNKKFKLIHQEPSNMAWRATQNTVRDIELRVISSLGKLVLSRIRKAKIQLIT